MKIGFIGLGKMGEAMVEHLVEQGVDVVVFNRTTEKIDELKSKIQISNQFQNSKSKTKPTTYNLQPTTNKIGNLIPAYNPQELVSNLETPRVIWLMVPQGSPVDEMIEKLCVSGVTKDDIIIDGGNSNYKDSQRRYASLKYKGISYMDVGTSGGLEGARLGASHMIGGEKEIFEKLVPLFEKLSLKDGYAYFGQAGAGHFVKMVHNGVEYGMLQSIGEGFELLQKGPYPLDLYKIASNWTHGSVVRGWLMELLEKALQHDPKLEMIEGVVGGGTTGNWTADAAKEFSVETPALNGAMKARQTSQTHPTFAGRIIAALRNQFGGHKVVEKVGSS